VYCNVFGDYLLSAVCHGARGFTKAFFLAVNTPRYTCLESGGTKGALNRFDFLCTYITPVSSLATSAHATQVRFRAYMYSYWRQNAKKYLWQEKLASTVTSQKGKLKSHDDCDKSAFRLFSSIIIALVKTLSTVNSHSSHDRHVTLVIPLELSAGTTDGADRTSNITTATRCQKNQQFFTGVTSRYLSNKF